jgi:hypothetical protein
MRSIMANSDWVELLKKLPGNAPSAGVTFAVEEVNAIMGGNAQRILNL